jgi:hypothetical protein
MLVVPLGPRMMFVDCTELYLASIPLRCHDGKTLLQCTLGALASCHGTVVRGVFLRLVRSCVLHSLTSVRATMAIQMRLDYRRASRTQERRHDRARCGPTLQSSFQLPPQILEPRLHCSLRQPFTIGGDCRSLVSLLQ